MLVAKLSNVYIRKMESNEVVALFPNKSLGMNISYILTTFKIIQY